MRKINVSFLGCGNIGGGVWALLEDMRADIARSFNVEFVVRKMLVKALDEPRAVAVPSELLTTDANDVLEDPEISLVCEFMGGEQPAASFMLMALKSGKNVVTANKMALSLHWQELHDAAKESNAAILYEASVCGAIPVIRTVRTAMTGSRIDKVCGIVNGTTNYILTQMCDNGLSYADALSQAQQLGLAEPDPTSDVEGYDAAYKLSILCALCFGTLVLPGDIARCGISSVDIQDIRLGAKLGYALKLLARAEKDAEGVHCSVSPTFVSQKNQLYHVNGAFNGVTLHGHASDDIFLFGRGAGALPTASAIVADMVQAASGRYEFTARQDFIACKTFASAKCPYYIRVSSQNAAKAVLCANEILKSSKVDMQMLSLDADEYAVMITPPVDCEIIRQLSAEIENTSGEKSVCWPIEDLS